MLSRRVPAPPPAQAPSALPPHLQRAMTQVPRPRSPITTPAPSVVSTSRPSSPVPYKSRQPNRPQTPVQTLPPAPSFLSTDIEVDLVVNEIMDPDIRLEEPFSIRFTATAAAFARPSRKRVLTLAVQHVVYSRPKTSSREPGGTGIQTNPKGYPHGQGHSPTPSGTSTPRILSMDFHPSAVASPKKYRAGKQDLAVSLPSPYSGDSFMNATTGADSHQPIGTGRVEFLGTSLTKLPPFELSGDSELMDAVISGRALPSNGKRIASHEFVLDFLAVKQGHANVGGVRLLLLMDEETDIGTEMVTPVTNEDPKRRPYAEAPWRGACEPRPAKVLYEWPVIAEVWVASGRN